MSRSPIDWSLSNWPRLIYRFFTSFKVATVVFVLLTILTLFGTLAQVDDGLYAAKKTYFHSLYLVEDIGGVPVPFPGGLLLMGFLFINMTLGAIVKVKKRWKGFGLLISHFGMLMLLAGSLVTRYWATDDHMALYPGMVSNRVESYRDWQLEIFKLDDKGESQSAWVLPHDELKTIRSDEQRVYEVEDLPFGVTVNGYAKNSTPIPAMSNTSAATGKVVDGFKLAPKKPSKEAEKNIPGAYVAFTPSGHDAPIEAILWAGSYRFDANEKPMPFQFTVGDQRYGAMLAKESRTLPFSIRLDEFIFERHPGVKTARRYESKITRIEDGKETPVEIKMNEPMRYQGYTFFQESFGPSNGRPGELFSQFAVANNPADHWPLWSLVVTTAGLLIHFVIMLVNFIVKSQRNSSASRPS